MCGEAPVFVVPDGQAAAGPRASTWSNPGGHDLLPVGEGLYVAERPFVWNGIDVGKPTAVRPSCVWEKRVSSFGWYVVRQNAHVLFIILFRGCNGRLHTALIVYKAQQ